MLLRAVGLLAALTLLACERHNVEPLLPAERVFVPDHFPEPAHPFEPEQISEKQIQLGRRLFYDPILSLDSSISCGSCHAQTHGFADHNRALSTGVGGAIGTRNAPALSNLAWHKAYMHDGGINHLNLVPLAPITDAVEMNLPIWEALDRLNSHSTYPGLFRQAYGNDSITTARLFEALTAFQLTLVSAASKYDRVMIGEASFSALENSGHEIFMANCASCHQPPLFTDYSYANNGLDSVYKDAGRGRITQLSADSGRFKVPSLRNLEFTYPYMHDGRFRNLRDVIEHYNQLGGNSHHFDARINADLSLTDAEIQALLAFLETLNDYEFISDLRHSEPKL